LVTAVFCDAVGWTALGDELDPEALSAVVSRYFQEIRATIERHGGTVEKFVGDAVMAVFGIPHVHEDDALRALRAAAEIRDRLPAVADTVGTELRFSTGVNTGTVFAHATVLPGSLKRQHRTTTSSRRCSGAAPGPSSSPAPGSAPSPTGSPPRPWR
jgi:class 3 adenylate cyclase